MRGSRAQRQDVTGGTYSENKPKSPPICGAASTSCPSSREISASLSGGHSNSAFYRTTVGQLLQHNVQSKKSNEVVFFVNGRMVNFPHCYFYIYVEKKTTVESRCSSDQCVSWRFALIVINLYQFVFIVLWGKREREERPRMREQENGYRRESTRERYQDSSWKALGYVEPSDYIL